MLDIVFQDSHLLILNKPSAIHSAKNLNSKEPSIAELLQDRFPGIDTVSENPLDCGLVNRLDFYTSGALVAALSQESYRLLRNLFSNSDVEKKYIALVDNKAPEFLVVENYIGSPYRRAQKVRVYADAKTAIPRSLPAKSEIRLIKYFEDKNLSLVEVQTLTGRRHQVRAHLGNIGNPLTGDHLYGSKNKLTNTSFFQNENNPPQFFLHAKDISFIHPITNEKIEIEIKSRM